MNINEELEKFVPTSEILKRPGGGGKQLAYVDRHYVITTLNRIYGHDGWSTTIDVNLCGDRYVATCELRIMTDSVGIARTEAGECLLASNGRPNENAATEAATQAFKRAASQLGNAFGLHLYRGLEVAAAPAYVGSTAVGPGSAEVNATAQAVAQGVATHTAAVMDGTLTKPDYQGAIQSAMANAPSEGDTTPQLDIARGIGLKFGFGKNPRYEKGTPIGDLDEGALGWYAEAIERGTQDPEKARWKDENMDMLNSIRLVLKNIHIPPASPPAQPQRGGESWPTDEDNPDNVIPF